MIKTYRKKCGLTFLEITILFGIIILSTLLIIIPSKPKRVDIREKACFSNQRLLLSSIEMYNIDHSSMLNNINDKAIGFMIKDGYLKGKVEDFVCPETINKDRNYTNLGDLFAGGIIYCKYHGTQEGIKITPKMTLSDYKKEKTKKEHDELVRKYIIIGVTVFIIIIYIGICFYYFKKKKK